MGGTAEKRPCKIGARFGHKGDDGLRHYSCDICGLPMPKEYERNKNIGIRAAELCGVEDVCTSCQKIGEKINISEILKNHWIKLSEKTTATGNKTNVKFAGAGGSEKSRILKKLTDYWKRHGLGSLETVSRKMGGHPSADVLRSLLVDGISMEIGDFQKINKALEALEKEEGASE